MHYNFLQDKTAENTDEEHRRELLIMGMVSVVVIMVFLIFAVPNILRDRPTYEYTKCQSNMKNIGTALELYASDNEGKYPPALQNLIPGYLESIPRCGGAVEELKGNLFGYIYVFVMGRRRIEEKYGFDYGETYKTSDDHKAYSFYCKGRNHSRLGVGGNFPQYNSTNGLIAK